MALGGATKKLSTLADTAEKLYQRVNEMREQIQELRETVTATKTTVEDLEREIDAQRAIIEALAREQGIDVDSVIAEATIEEAEPLITEAEPDAEAETSAGDEA
jgi:chromosome segregation ATPase